MKETVYIQLGSNLGDRLRYLGQAISDLSEIAGLEITSISSVYESKAAGMDEDSPDFLNQVVKVTYSGRPFDLLHALEEIERLMGRDNKGTYQSRTIDLDILLFGEKVIESLRLTVPHPRLSERPFVLVPLLELEPMLTDPRDNCPLVSYLDDYGRKSVHRYKSYVARAV